MKLKNWTNVSWFFANIRKSDGSDYELDSLRVMLAALDRHLKQNDSKISGLWYFGQLWPGTGFRTLTLYRLTEQSIYYPF